MATTSIDDDVITSKAPLAAYLASFVVLGMGLSIVGPALPHLRERAGIGIGDSGLIIAGQACGYISGSLIAGRPYDRGHGHRLLLGGGSVLIVAAASLQLVSQLGTIIAVFAVIGFGAAIIDVGGNTLVVWSQPPHRVGSALNALHLCFGIGALVTPLVVSRSLAWTDSLVVVAAVMVVGLSVVAVLLRGPEATPQRRVEVAASQTGQRSRYAFALVCVFFFLYVGAEATFAGWVVTYGSRIGSAIDLGGGADAANILNSVFWAGFTLGRIVAIGVISRISAASTLVGTCALATVAAVVLGVGDGSAIVVWAATAAFGFMLGPQFATMMAFGDQRLRLSGSSTSVIVAASGFGGLVLPLATGWLLDRNGAETLPWAGAAVCAATTIVAVAVTVAGRQRADGHRPPLTSMNAPVT